MYVSDETVPQATRVKVKITCSRCGEKYIMRSEKHKDGRIETGFKRCVCDSEDVTMEVME